MKKILAFTLVFLFMFSTVGFAAVSGSRTRTTVPRTPTTQTAPSQSPTYKPSAPASSYSNTAPAARTPTAPAQTQQTGGSFWRNAAWFGGGMLLGGLLGHMFPGYHMGGFATVMISLLVNILILLAIFMAIRWMWQKLTGKRDEDNRRIY